MITSSSIQSSKKKIDDEIVELNVAGQRISTLKSTLTLIPQSKLINHRRDGTGALYFDYNPIYFASLIDQLRLLKRWSPKSRYRYEFVPPFISRYLNFTEMLVDLGLTGKPC